MSKRQEIVAAAKRRFRSKKFASPMLNDAYSRAKPWQSITMGCHPSQVAEFNRIYESHGVDAGHLPNGTLEAYSRQGRNDVMKALGRRDHDAGYGDHNGT
jgi:hypothetical protein